MDAGLSDLRVLEAQESPGGRIKTIRVGGAFVDLGAQWLHGDNNMLWQVSDKHNLISAKTVYEGRGLYLREDGHVFDEFLVEKVGFIVGQILEECEKFVNTSDFPDSVGKYLDEKFADYLKVSSLSDKEMREYLELYDWNVRFQVIDNCCDSLYNVSAKSWGRYFCPTFEGQAHINYSKGHASVIDVLVEKLPENTLITNCPVNNISWQNIKNSPIELSCRDGRKILADAAIVTVSLGVLKHSHTSLFSPLLPNPICETIQAMGFAGICKIFLLFEEKWWNSEGFQFIWNYDRPYSDDWIRYLSGFDLVLDQPRMLLGWVGGRGARLVENVSEESIGRRCAEMFRKFTGNPKIPNPIQVVRTNWTSNEWVRGGYSHTTPACEADHLPEILQEPVRDTNGVIRVLLAGEHTHPQHFSTTHGAYESGVKQATLLLSEL